jgi:hypothetical protein
MARTLATVAVDPPVLTSSARRVVLGCLVGLAAALLLVGIVSGTILRHIVQILPFVAAALLLKRQPAWGAWAALPIFAFWTLVVVLIWLFLLGLSRIASGHYTVIEIISTFLMAGFSAVGAVRSIRLGRSLPVTPRVLMITGFALAQFAAMWVSFLKPIANR